MLIYLDGSPTVVPADWARVMNIDNGRLWESLSLLCIIERGSQTSDADSSVPDEQSRVEKRGI